MKKKMLAVLVSTATVATLLAGCGSTATTTTASSTSEAASEEASEEEAVEEEASEEEAVEEEAAPAEENSSAGVTITFMHDWPEYTEEFQTMADDFEAETGIHVDISIITWDVLTKTVTTQYANDELPDVWCSWSNQMGQFNYMGMVYDMTPYLDENDGEWRDCLLKPAVDLGTVSGSVYAIPYRTTQTILCYNKTLMDENGWEVPTNLEEFEALLQQIVDESDYTPILAPGTPDGFQVAAITSTFAEQYLLDEGTLKTDEWLSGHYAECTDAYTYAGEKVKDWFAKGYIIDSALALEREEAVSLFFNEKGIFSFLNNNELSEIEEGCAETGFEVGFMAFPQPEGQEYFLYNFGVDSFSVSSATEHPDEAAAWLKYITSDEVQQKFGNETLSIMANKNVQYDDPNQNVLSNMFATASSYRINYDYNAGNISTDIADEIAAFVADDSYTPEQLGQKITQMRQDCIDENAN